jgi:hypothetical protein
MRSIADTVALADQLADHLAMGRKGCQRTGLVGAHEAAIPGDIGRQDSGKLAFDGRRAHARLFTALAADSSHLRQIMYVEAATYAVWATPAMQRKSTRASPPR